MATFFLPVPDTDFRDFLEEVDELRKFAPEIIDTIEADLDTQAQAKKKLRLEDQEFFARQTLDLPGVDVEKMELLANELMEKVLAYNCCRIILMKKRKREALEKAA